MLNFHQDPLEKAEQEGTLPDANPYPQIRTVVDNILSNSNGIFIGDDGLTLDTTVMPQSEFCRFFQGIISNGGYFIGFDGETYNKIMAYNETDYANMGRVRIAREIEPFPEEIDFFSKRIRKDHESASFEFWPFIRSADPEIEWSEDKKYDLTQDEVYGLFFRAGIFGWFEVHTIAANSQWLDHFEIRVIAKRVDPIAGKEATIDELREIRPVRSIKIIDKQTGTADMKRCECAFPQVTEIGERLLKKTPASPGTNGVQIDGRLIAFKTGKDINLAPLAGKGTEIQRELDGTEYIVSTRTGYVSIERGRTIEITNEKKNYLPIGPQMGGSIKVTEGTLHQHGDVIHGYELEADSLIMPSSSVFGTLIVNNGDFITSGFAGEGSRIRVANGNVKVARATKARIDALSGSIHIPVAENSIIIGNEVHIDSAHNTIVIANVANIGKCHGWSVYAPNIQIGRSQRMARVETAIVCPIYDIRSERKAIRKLEMEIQHEKQALENFSKREAELRANPDLQQYIKITQAIKAKTFQPTAEQQAKMAALQKRIRPIVEELRNLPEKHKDILTKIEQIENESKEKMAKLEEHIKQIQQGIRMQIDELESGVGVRVGCIHTYLMPTNIKAVGDMPETEGDMLISMVLDYLNAGTTQLGTEKLLDVWLGWNVSADFETFKEIGRKNQSKYTGRLSRSLDGKAESRSENRYLVLSSQTFLRHMHSPEWMQPDAEHWLYSAKLDYRYQAWLSDITSEGASFLIPKKQEFTPFFEQDEDILIHLTAFGETYRLPFVIRYYQDMGEMYKIGGPFIFAQGMDMQNRMFQLRNAIERHRIKESAFTRY